jgi:hypothetical protein
MSETLAEVLRVLLWLLPGGLWCAWWLWCANWKKAWPVLAEGAWVVVVLVVFLSALAWSATFPVHGSRRFLGVPLGNFWYHLVASSALALVALFCGWLQGRLGWAPAEVSFDPPPPEPAHGHHGHAHGHAGH